MPQIVAHGGAKPAGRACAQCHLPSGDGHPESSSLAGLPADYIVRQMAAFKNGERKGVRAAMMIAMAKVLSDAEVKAAADYFAALKPTPGFNKVREADKVPASYVGAGGMRFALADGGYEPVGSRIIVLPDNAERAALRDPKSGFTDFVAKGSIARGAALMAGGDGKTHRLHHLPRPGAQGPRRSARHHRAARDLHLPPAQRHEDRQPQRLVGRADEAGGRQAHPRRHDRACGVSRLARSVMAQFKNLGDLIDRDRDLTKLAIIDLGGEEAPTEYTYAELDAMTMGVARALAKRGFARGDRIAILSANRAEFIAAYFGIMRAGFVAVPVNYRFPKKTIHFIIQDAGAKLVFCDRASRENCPEDLPAVVFGEEGARRASTASSIRASSRP